MTREFEYEPHHGDTVVESYSDGGTSLTLDARDYYSSTVAFKDIEDFGQFINWLQTVHGQIHTESTQTR